VKHEPKADLPTTAALLGVELSPEAAERLLAYEDLLRDRAVPLGYVARSDAGRLRERHLLDCLRAVPFVPERGSACDLGSGAGLPGIVVAIARPDLSVQLVEPRRGKVAFLELAMDRLGLGNVQVVARPAETLDVPVDACLARAFAPIERAWGVARGLLRPGGRLLYFSGGRGGHGPVPPGVRAEMVPAHPMLASSGPLVIMTGQ
jgi:16S rRNA (guanine527-N7)-methyltransferase